MTTAEMCALPYSSRITHLSSTFERRTYVRHGMIAGFGPIEAVSVVLRFVWREVEHSRSFSCSLEDFDRHVAPLHLYSSPGPYRLPLSSP